MSFDSADPFPIEATRELFPALSLKVGDRDAAFFDGPGGTQVPGSVIDAMGDYLREANANRDPAFLTGERTEALIDAAHHRAAALLGCDGGETVFGQNMTTLAFGLSHCLSRDWGPGDEIVVTSLDHAANVDPWVRAAERAGATVRRWDVDPETCELPLSKLGDVLDLERTKFLAVGLASNAVGTLNPVREACAMARDCGAVTFVDAVHAAPHVPIDVRQLGCDFLACSPYKFFGPHLGLLYGRRELLETARPRPRPPDRRQDAAAVDDRHPEPRGPRGVRRRRGLPGVPAARGDTGAGVGGGPPTNCGPR